MTATGSGFMVPEPPLVLANAAVTAHAADYTFTIADFGVNITNTGAVGSANFTFPAAKDVAGMSTHIQITVAQAVGLIPASGEGIFLGGSGAADKELTISGVIGNYADIYCDGERFHVIDYNGVLTKAA